MNVYGVRLHAWRLTTEMRDRRPETLNFERTAIGGSLHRIVIRAGKKHHLSPTGMAELADAQSNHGRPWLRPPGLHREKASALSRGRQSSTSVSVSGVRVRVPLPTMCKRALRMTVGTYNEKLTDAAVSDAGKHK